MIKYCADCQRPILDGERISFVGNATYHVIDSLIAYAIDKHDLEIDPDSICHSDCEEDFSNG